MDKLDSHGPDFKYSCRASPLDQHLRAWHVSQALPAWEVGQGPPVKLVSRSGPHVATCIDMHTVTYYMRVFKLRIKLHMHESV